MATAAPTLPARRAAGTPSHRGLVLAFVARRLLLMIPMLFGIVTVAFLVTHVLPGDPATALGGQFATPDTIAQIRVQYGLDGSMLHQYGQFLTNLLHLDLGRSAVTGQPVLSDLLHRICSTLFLIGGALAVALAIGIPLGAYAGRTQSRFGRGLVRATSFILLATPEFWLALIAIYLLFFVAGVFPAPTGQLGIGDVAPPDVTGVAVIDSLLAGQWSTFGSAVSHALLPILVYGVVLSAPITRLMRSAMLEVMSADFVRFGRACGVPRPTLWRWAVRSALPSVVTFTGVLFTLLLGGAVLIETIFSWGGMAQYASSAITRNDYNAVQGFVLVCGVLSVLAFLVVDLLQMAIDPRIRLQPGGAAAAGRRWPWTRPAETVPTAPMSPVALDGAASLPAPATGPRTRRLALVRETWEALAEIVTDIRPNRLHGAGRLSLRANPALWSGTAIVAVLLIGSFVIPAISSDGVNTPDPVHALLSPGGSHLFGTDATGFDVFVRVFYAPRIDLWLAFAGVGIGAVLGVALGLMVGVTRNVLVSEAVMRVVDVLQAFPVLILAIALVSLAGNSFTNVIWALAFINTPIFLRLVRTQVLSIREHRFVEASIALGTSQPRLVLRHILPNALGPVVVQLGISMGYAILTVAGLAFLGVGVQAPTAEWGSMILSGRDGITTGQWWIVAFPGLLMLLAVIGFNLLAEGIERARDIHR
jgi:ABC-type dipeptide/oligopeptide/nickel transport system permease component